MKITAGTARRLLREVNPVPDDAFAEAARDFGGQASLADILDSTVAPVMPAGLAGAPACSPQPAGLAGRDPRYRDDRCPGRRPGLRTARRWRVGARQPWLFWAGPQWGARHPGRQPDGAPGRRTGRRQRRAARVSRRRRGAAGSAALGPVEYSRAESWGLDLGTTHYGLGYVSHQTNLDENWIGSDGASLEVRTWPGGKVPQGNIPVGRTGPSAAGKARFSQWYNPATLPTSESLMRQHLLGMTCPVPGFCFSGGNQTSQIVTSSRDPDGQRTPAASRAGGHPARARRHRRPPRLASGVL